MVEEVEECEECEGEEEEKGRRHDGRSYCSGSIYSPESRLYYTMDHC